MPCHAAEPGRDRKSTRLNSSHRTISYAVFCLKKKKQHQRVELVDDLIMPERGYFVVMNFAFLDLLLYRHFFFFNDTATPDIYTLSLHDALPICCGTRP